MAVRIDRVITHTWEPVRSIPKTDAWFETAWAAFRNGEIYGCQGTVKNL